MNKIVESIKKMNNGFSKLGVIGVAHAMLGYLEKQSNKDLWDKTANAGNKNYTIIAELFKEYTGMNFQAQPWCMMTLVVIVCIAYGKEKALKLLHKFTAKCSYQVDYFKKVGEYFSKPKIGDFIFFKNTKGEVNHVGLVINIDARYVYTIEGNTSSGDNTVVANGGGIFKKKYLLTNGRIHGYGRPNYMEVE